MSKPSDDNEEYLQYVSEIMEEITIVVQDIVDEVREGLEDGSE